MSPTDQATLATSVIMKDLYERKGFRELIDAIPDWHQIGKVIEARVERALAEAQANESNEASF